MSYSTAPIVNWVYDKEKVPEASRRAAEKAHKIEEQRIKKGWRWISITPRTKIFVPCNKNGTPTKEGMELIEQAKKNCV